MALLPRKKPLEVGELAPDFEAENQSNHTLRLKDLLSTSVVVLVFYPGDSTPLCTSQLCGIRDIWKELQEAGATVLGVNSANAEKHTRFAEKNQFPFDLIVDSGSQIAGAFGCRGFLGLPRRTVIVLDKTGRAVFVQQGVPPPEAILAAVRKAQAE